MLDEIAQRRHRKQGGPATPAIDAELLHGMAGLNRFLERIYDGPAEFPPWRSVLHLLQEALSARHVTLILRPPSQRSAGSMVNTDSVDSGATSAYLQHYYAFDPFVDLPDGQIVSPEQAIGPNWGRSVLYRDYLEPLNIAHLIGADLHIGGGAVCRFRVSRGSDAEAFSMEDRALCQVLLPHLRRSIHMHAQLDELEGEMQLFSGTVNRLQLGMLHLAADGTVLDCSEEARRILDGNDGIRLSAGRLCIDSVREARRFRDLFQSALERRGETPLVEAMSVTRVSGATPLGLVVRALPEASLPARAVARPAVAVILRDPDAGVAEGAQAVVQRLFGLTPSEAALALCLADGLSVDEAADQLGVRRNTARTYLRFIFCKTGVSRQTTLIRRILNSVAALA
jgi:DNA-binding CsgD family transcriptional regulator